MQAVAQRFHASRNPDAIMRDAITLDDWAASRPIAEPIRLFDCSLENDGADRGARHDARTRPRPRAARGAGARAGAVRRADPHRARRRSSRRRPRSANAKAARSPPAGGCSAPPGITPGRRRRRDDRRAVHDRGAARARAVRVLRDGGGRAVHRERRDPLARRRAAGEHARRLERRGVRARREPSARSGAPAARDRVQSGRRARRSRSCAARSATRRARCCSESTDERAPRPLPRPDPTNADDAAFWAVARRRASSASSGARRAATFRHPPRPVCAHCGATEREWTRSRDAARCGRSPSCTRRRCPRSPTARPTARSSCGSTKACSSSATSSTARSTSSRSACASSVALTRVAADPEAGGDFVLPYFRRVG